MRNPSASVNLLLAHMMVPPPAISPKETARRMKPKKRGRMRSMPHPTLGALLYSLSPGAWTGAPHSGQYVASSGIPFPHFSQ